MVVLMVVIVAVVVVVMVMVMAFAAVGVVGGVGGGGGGCDDGGGRRGGRVALQPYCGAAVAARPVDRRYIDEPRAIFKALVAEEAPIFRLWMGVEE